MLQLEINFSVNQLNHIKLGPAQQDKKGAGNNFRDSYMAISIYFSQIKKVIYTILLI